MIGRRHRNVLRKRASRNDFRLQTKIAASLDGQADRILFGMVLVIRLAMTVNVIVGVISVAVGTMIVARTVAADDRDPNDRRLQRSTTPEGSVASARRFDGSRDHAVAAIPTAIANVSTVQIRLRIWELEIVLSGMYALLQT